jgi:hypothetical protein
MDDATKITERELPGETGQQILAALAEIRFGAIEIVIHDGKVVQIERKEKIRFN